jgi:hypothetical protein
VAAEDETYDGQGGGSMDDTLDEVDPEERQPPSRDEDEQDDYANTDEEER